MGQELVRLLHDSIGYTDLWAVAVTAAQRGVEAELQYWLALYRIKRDGLWQNEGFDSQQEWVQYLTTLPRFEGGTAYSTFFDKMGLIEDLIEKGVSDEDVVRALSMPTAAKKLVGATDDQLNGRTVGQVLQELDGLNPGKAALTASEIVQEPKIWVSYIKYAHRIKLVELAFSEDNKNEIDNRVYFIPEVERQDAEYLAKKLQKRLEWT